MCFHYLISSFSSRLLYYQIPFYTFHFILLCYAPFFDSFLQFDESPFPFQDNEASCHDCLVPSFVIVSSLGRNTPALPHNLYYCTSKPCTSEIALFSCCSDTYYHSSSRTSELVFIAL